MRICLLLLFLVGIFLSGCGTSSSRSKVDPAWVSATIFAECKINSVAADLMEQQGYNSSRVRSFCNQSELDPSSALILAEVMETPFAQEAFTATALDEMGVLLVQKLLARGVPNSIVDEVVKHRDFKLTVAAYNYAGAS